MAELRNQFHKTTSTGFMRETNLWTLITDTVSGASNVQHAWSYVDPFGHGIPDYGMCTISVENFLSGSADDDVKQKLRTALLDVTL
jgi:hypothetical protein